LQQVVFNRQRNNLHLPQANFFVFQKGTYYSLIKTLNTFPTEIKDLSNKPKICKIALKLDVILTVHRR